MSDTKRFFEEFEIPSYKKWKEAAVAALKGKPFDKVMYTDTYEGIRLEPIYTKEHIEKIDFANSLPGFYPFVRGTEIDGYKTNPWEIAQELPYYRPELFNKTALDNLKKGQTALNIHADIVWNPDNPAPEKDFAPRRLNINKYEDFKTAFAGIDLTLVSVYLSGDEISYIYAAMYMAYCKETGCDLSKIKVFFGIDPAGTAASEGKLWASPEVYFDQAATLIKEYNEAKVIRPLLVDASVYHNGGGSNVHEIAAAMSTGAHYIRMMLDRGIDVDKAAGAIWFKFSVGNNFFMEIAKFRVVKMLWAKIAKQFGAGEDAQKAYIHAQTSERQSTKHDAYVNMLRNTSQAFSAVLGGISSLNVLPFNSKHVLPDEFANRTARNLQNVLLEEPHIKDTADPAGGAWYIESLTAELAEKSWDYFRSIEKTGILEFLKSGQLQKDIGEIADLRDKNFSIRKDTLLGTNLYPNPDEKEITSKVNITSEELTEFFNRTTKEYKEKQNVMLSGLDSFDALQKAITKNAHVFDLVRAVFGKSEEMLVDPVVPRRSAELFEELRENSARFKANTGKAPTVKLACYGLLRQYKPRADFSTDFFQTGGFEVQITDGFEKPEEIIDGLKNTDSKIIVFCSTDPLYEEFIPQAAKAVKQFAPQTKLILAGYPKDKLEEYKAAGIDEFIHVRADVYRINRYAQEIVFSS